MSCTLPIFFKNSWDICRRAITAGSSKVFEDCRNSYTETLPPIRSTMSPFRLAFPSTSPVKGTHFPLTSRQTLMKSTGLPKTLSCFSPTSTVSFPALWINFRLNLFYLVVCMTAAFFLAYPIILVLASTPSLCIMIDRPLQEPTKAKIDRWQTIFQTFVFAPLMIGGLVTGIIGMGTSDHARTEHGVSSNSRMPWTELTVN